VERIFQAVHHQQQPPPSTYGDASVSQRPGRRRKVVMPRQISCGRPPGSPATGDAVATDEAAAEGTCEDKEEGDEEEKEKKEAPATAAGAAAGPLAAGSTPSHSTVSVMQWSQTLQSSSRLPGQPRA